MILQVNSQSWSTELECRVVCDFYFALAQTNLLETQYSLYTLVVLRYMTNNITKREPGCRKDYRLAFLLFDISYSVFKWLYTFTSEDVIKNYWFFFFQQLLKVKTFISLSQNYSGERLVPVTVEVCENRILLWVPSARGLFLPLTVLWWC